MRNRHTKHKPNSAGRSVFLADDDLLTDLDIMPISMAETAFGKLQVRALLQISVGLSGQSSAVMGPKCKELLWSDTTRRLNRASLEIHRRPDSEERLRTPWLAKLSVNATEREAMTKKLLRRAGASFDNRPDADLRFDSSPRRLVIVCLPREVLELARWLPLWILAAGGATPLAGPPCAVSRDGVAQGHTWTPAAIAVWADFEAARGTT
jgi:hypothetical protein